MFNPSIKAPYKGLICTGNNNKVGQTKSACKCFFAEWATTKYLYYILYLNCQLTKAMEANIYFL